MALVVWLPLTNQGKNQGVGQVDVTYNSNVTATNTNPLFGTAMSFNNQNGYIELSGTDLSDCFRGTPTPSFSVCFWVYHNDTNRIIFFGQYPNGIPFNVELTADKYLRFWWKGSPNIVFNRSGKQALVPVNQWVHVCVTYNGSQVKAYIDGVLKDSQDYVLSTTTANYNFRIGKDYRSSGADATAFTGYMQDFRLYSHELSQAEINNLVQMPIRRYTFDSIDNSTIKEADGLNDYDLSLTGGSGVQVVTDPCYATRAVKFTGSTYYTAPSLPTNYANNMSFAAWVKWNTTSNSVVFADYGTKSSLGLYNTNKLIVGAGASYVVFAPSNFAPSSWNHICVTYSSTGVKCYVNGVEVTTTSGTNNWTHSLNRFTLGARNNGSYNTFFVGEISDFRVYRGILTADFVYALYHHKAQVDNLGNLHIGEIVEDDELVNPILPDTNYIASANGFDEQDKPFQITLNNDGSESSKRIISNIVYEGF